MLRPAPNLWESETDQPDIDKCFYSEQFKQDGTHDQNVSVHALNREWTPMDANGREFEVASLLKRMEQANESCECDESRWMEVASTHSAHKHLAPGH